MGNNNSLVPDHKEKEVHKLPDKNPKNDTLKKEDVKE